MIAIRHIIRPVNNQVTITLPKDFNAESVEVIVMPAQQSEALIKKKRVFGAGKADIIIHDSFYQPLEDFQEYM